MLVFSRNISCKISTDENFFEKNLGWQVVLEDFPKECEIMFSKMKDDIFDDLNISFDNPEDDEEEEDDEREMDTSLNDDDEEWIKKHSN